MDRMAKHLVHRQWTKKDRMAKHLVHRQMCGHGKDGKTPCPQTVDEGQDGKTPCPQTVDEEGQNGKAPYPQTDVRTWTGWQSTLSTDRRTEKDRMAKHLVHRQKDGEGQGGKTPCPQTEGRRRTGWQKTYIRSDGEIGYIKAAEKKT
ncbi:hypothetical protein PoB_007716800 [Plakobranchus ocellatus]|uniref:Uncharacterized protein n=1 Tax=Plakobranchus ocellatus TaxID=259542 RepID=A0AAV4E3B5_9GAST|nr:hypothetical protein PoB_007716800 [Plakobranchus ocellatus]